MQGNPVHDQAQSPTRRGAASQAVLAAMLASATLWLAGCGGGGSDEPAVAAEASGLETAAATSATKRKKKRTSTTTTTTTTTATTTATTQSSTAAATAAAPSRAEAFRLLTQASFGPTEASLAQVSSKGVEGWLNAQFAMPVTAVHLPRWQATTRTLRASNPTAHAGTAEIVHSFYQSALLSEDQLRQRVAFALSEIFVVSLADLGGERAEALADYQDMLARNAFGNYRTLLEGVARHPAMGLYLSHIKNRPAGNTGRQPDQNFAREIMQLFSVGLYKLQTDGQVRLGSNGLPLETYSSSDIEGLAAVFTGFSFGGPDTTSARFWAQTGYRASNMYTIPMQGYPQYHEKASKTFLGRTVAAQSVADPSGSLKAALDTLFNHPNVGPFIGRQLIQRLVTSNPSPAYVGRVAAVFNNNGSGVRGDLKAVVRAILTDAEARTASVALNPTYGKLREPVLRLTAFLRAFGAKSDSGKVLMTWTDDPATTLGQTPFNSPSVFNFFRPGHVPAGGEAATLGLTLPEMQITSESSVAGYANYMMNVVARGAGPKGTTGTAARPDLQPDYTAAMAVATQPAQLTNLVLTRLMPEAPTALATEITNTLNGMAIPKATSTNAAAVETAKRNRVQAAILLALVSPEFIVQK